MSIRNDIVAELRDAATDAQDELVRENERQCVMQDECDCAKCIADDLLIPQLERIEAAQDAGEPCPCPYCVTTSVNFHARPKAPPPPNLAYWNEVRPRHG